MMKPMAGCLGALTVALALLCSAAQAAPIDVAGLIDPSRATAAPGCVAGVYRRGEIVAQGASGVADVSTGAPLTPQTRLYAGSVSKQFTALAVAQLVVAGRVSLDEEVQAYLPELPRYASRITVRMLLHHVSGVRDSLDLLALAGVETSRAPMQDALRLMYLQRGLNFTPGTRFIYSNGGYLLLAEIVERTSGLPFQDYMRQAVLDPLGMSHSFFLATLPAPGQLAHGYVPHEGAFAVRDTYPDFGGSGGLVTTLEDMARYNRDVVARRRVFTPAVERILTEPGRFNDGALVLAKGTGTDPDEAYAGGLFVGSHGGVKAIEHGGAAEGFLAQYIRLPEKGLEAIVLCNRGDRRPAPVADRLIEAVAGPIFAPLTSAPAEKRESPPSGAIAPGRYVSDELAATWEITAAEGGITTAVSSEWRNPPRPAPSLRFKRNAAGSYVAGGVTLVADADSQGFLVDTGRTSGVRFRLAR